MAQKLGVTVGDKITVYSPGNLGSVLDKLKALEEKKGDEKEQAVEDLREVVLPKELTVTGIFETGQYLHDSEFLLVPIFIGQELYGLGDSLHGLTVKTVDPYDATHVKQAIAKFLKPPEYAMTWIEMNRQYFDAVRLERTVMAFLLFFIVIVAAFGIMNTLITVTVQKRREIGIMKAVGATIGQIMGVFLFQGIVVGVFGTLTGLGLGMTLIRFRNEFSQWLVAHPPHRDLPERSLSVLANPGGSDPERRRKNLHRGLHHLFVSRAHSRLLRGPGRSGEGAALRVAPGQVRFSPDESLFPRRAGRFLPAIIFSSSSPWQVGSVGPFGPAINEKKNNKKRRAKMKAKSKRPEVRLEWRNKRSGRLLAGAGLAVAAFLACNLVSHVMAADAVNACQQTAADVSAACRASAQSDYQIALGKCVNLSDPTARKACQKQAAADLDDALQTCKDGLAVRKGTCEKLGPAPYDPVIDPANFVAKIDNPYFPLVPGTTFIYEGQTSWKSQCATSSP